MPCPSSTPAKPEGPEACPLAVLTPGQVVRLWLHSALLPFTLGSLLGILCYVAAGNTLGFYLGPLAMITLVGPPLLLAESHWLNRLFVADGLVFATALVWLAGLFHPSLVFLDWLRCCLILGAYTSALLALAVFLHRLRLPPLAASTISVIFALAWLTWPIWLAPWLTGDGRERLVAALIAPHPLFALNALLTPAFPVPWAQYRIAYALTNIGDDIPYEMPASIVPCLLLHVLLAAALLLLSWRPPQQQATRNR